MSVHGVPLLGGLLETMILNSYEAVISKVCHYVHALAVKLVQNIFWGCHKNCAIPHFQLHILNPA